VGWVINKFHSKLQKVKAIVMIVPGLKYYPELHPDIHPNSGECSLSVIVGIHQISSMVKF
jgi:hypothetical protein